VAVNDNTDGLLDGSDVGLYEVGAKEGLLDGKTDIFGAFVGFFDGREERVLVGTAEVGFRVG